jgi:polyisoprenoid-binding protein YceI
VRRGVPSLSEGLSRRTSETRDHPAGAHLDGDHPSKSTAQLTIRARSVRTGNRKRDDHLRGGDFLDTDDHPTITFTSTRVEQVDETRFLAEAGAL